MKKMLIGFSLIVVLGIGAYFVIFNTGFVGWLGSFNEEACGFIDCSKLGKDQEGINWLDKAVEERDPSLCDKSPEIDHGDYKTTKDIAAYFCKARYGGRIKDIEYCLELDDFVKHPGTKTQRYACFQEMSKYVDDLSVCERFPMDTYLVNSRYECYSSLAERTEDVSICKLIPEQGYDRNYKGSRKNCLIALGKKLDDSSVCEYLTQSHVVKECVGSIGVVGK